jgi:hypothetical protein
MLPGNFPGRVRHDEIRLAGLTAEQTTVVAVVQSLHHFPADAASRNKRAGLGYGFGIHFASRLIRAMSHAPPGTVTPVWQSVQTQTV